MEEAPENGKESPHSAHANGMNDMVILTYLDFTLDLFSSICIPALLLKTHDSQPLQICNLHK
jgi:hypothetical protein